MFLRTNCHLSPHNNLDFQIWKHSNTHRHTDPRPTHGLSGHLRQSKPPYNIQTLFVRLPCKERRIVPHPLSCILLEHRFHLNYNTSTAIHNNHPLSNRWSHHHVPHTYSSLNKRLLYNNHCHRKQYYPYKVLVRIGPPYMFPYPHNHCLLYTPGQYKSHSHRFALPDIPYPFHTVLGFYIRRLYTPNPLNILMT